MQLYIHTTRRNYDYILYIRPYTDKISKNSTSAACREEMKKRKLPPHAFIPIRDILPLAYTPNTKIPSLEKIFIFVPSKPPSLLPLVISLTRSPRPRDASPTAESYDKPRGLGHLASNEKLYSVRARASFHAQARSLPV